MKKIDKNLIINALLVLLLGIILGAFSKWLDNLSINDEIWWQYINRHIRPKKCIF